MAEATPVLITTAAAFAAEAHAGQVRKELNEPYIVHPLRVGKMAATLGQSAEFIAACYLHDVLEDTKVPYATLKNIFPAKTCELVVVVSKWWESDHPSETIAANKTTYYERILRTEDAVLLKILDRVDNLYDFTRMARMSAPKSHKWAANYHAKTTREFLPLLATLTESEVDVTARKYFDAALQALEMSL